MSASRDRVKRIIDDCCAGNASLAADILDAEFVIIDRNDLPEVKASPSDPNSYRVEGESVVYTSAQNARMWVMRDVAVWQFLEQENIRVQSRRDELANELAPRSGDLGANWYGNVSDGLRRAIDRIIELEAQVAA